MRWWLEGAARSRKGFRREIRRHTCNDGGDARMAQPWREGKQQEDMESQSRERQA